MGACGPACRDSVMATCSKISWSQELLAVEDEATASTRNLGLETNRDGT